MVSISSKNHRGLTQGRVAAKVFEYNGVSDVTFSFSFWRTRFCFACRSSGTFSNQKGHKPIWWVLSHSMAMVNLNKSKETTPMTTTALKLPPYKTPPFGPHFRNFAETVSYEVNLASQSSYLEALLLSKFWSRVLSLMLWWLLAWFPYFYSD